MQDTTRPLPALCPPAARPGLTSDLLQPNQASHRISACVVDLLPARVQRPQHPERIKPTSSRPSGLLSRGVVSSQQKQPLFSENVFLQLSPRA